MTTHMVMASAICTPTFSSSRFTTKSAIYTSSSSLFSHPKTPKFHLSTWFPPLGRGVFSPWSGLKHLGISIAPKPLKSGTFSHLGLCFVFSSQLNPFGMRALLFFEIEMMVVQIGKGDVRVRWFMHLCLELEHRRLWSLEWWLCWFLVLKVLLR